LFFCFGPQNELTTKGLEVIALKSEVRDLSKKLESKDRRVRRLDADGNRPEGGGGGGGNCCDDQLAADKLYSLVGRLNEQVRTLDIAVLAFSKLCVRWETRVTEGPN